MNLLLNPSHFLRMLLVSLCLVLAAPLSHGQSSGETSQDGQQTRSTQEPQRTVSLRPVDTGRSVVTFSPASQSPRFDRFAIKTNLLYALGTLTPNLGAEVGLGRRTSVGLSVGYNRWGNLWDYSVEGPDYDPDNLYKRCLDHVSVELEFRYWLNRRFSGHFVGVNALWADYRVGELGLGPIFEKMYEHDGYSYGGGLTYGYLLDLNERWGLEFTLGLGVAVLEHDKKTIAVMDEGPILGDAARYRKTYVGPTGVGITILFKL
jgi:hypothetical protein